MHSSPSPLRRSCFVLAPSLRHTRAWLQTSPFPGARHNFMMDIPARYVPLAHAAADYGTTPDYFEYFDPQPRPPSGLLQPAAMLSIIFWGPPPVPSPGQALGHGLSWVTWECPGLLCLGWVYLCPALLLSL